MHLIPLRIVVGFVVMSGVCFTAYRVGDAYVRRAAVVLFASWGLGFLAQLITGRIAEPVIVSEIVCGVIVLRWAWTQGRLWLWLSAIVESLLLVLHAIFYQFNQPPRPIEVVLNNGLSYVGLAILLGAAFIHRGETQAD